MPSYAESQQLKVTFHVGFILMSNPHKKVYAGDAPSQIISITANFAS
jgi:hypothetical protein